MRWWLLFVVCVLLSLYGNVLEVLADSSVTDASSDPQQQWPTKHPSLGGALNNETNGPTTPTKKKFHLSYLLYLLPVPAAMLLYGGLWLYRHVRYRSKKPEDASDSDVAFFADDLPDDVDATRQHAARTALFRPCGMASSPVERTSEASDGPTSHAATSSSNTDTLSGSRPGGSSSHLEVSEEEDSSIHTATEEQGTSQEGLCQVPVAIDDQSTAASTQRSTV